MDDWQCLSEYVREGSQSAFREVVARHVDLVYATCRRVVRDAHLAEDATQASKHVAGRLAAQHSAICLVQRAAGGGKSAAS